jgi:hypothetical protein
MNRLSKFMIAGLAVAAMTGTALAQDAPDPAADPAADPATDPATDPAAPTTDPATTEDPAPAGGKAKTIGADAVVVVPLGDYADAVTVAFGAMGRFEFGLNPALAITARAGLIYNLAKELLGETPTILMIPVQAGVKYMIGTSGLFGQGEVGFTHTRTSVGDFSDSTTKLSFEAGAGFQKGKLSFRAGFWYIASDPALMGIMASAGFDFASL